MTTYIVTSKATGLEVYRYVADAPVEWAGMEFSTHHHGAEVVIPKPEVVRHVEQPRRMTRLQFVGLMTQPEFVGLLATAKSDPDVEMFVKLLDWTTPDPDGTSVDRDDPRTVAGVRALFSPERADEILGVL